jgi:F0F1-type ATP synthase delta subunit
MSRDLAEAVINLLEKQSNPKKAAKAVASYLVTERRTNELNSLLRRLEELNYEREGQLEVTATAARPLTDSVKREIRQLFDAKRVIVHEEIDENVLGGVKVRALDKAADFSVQARLLRLRRGA